MIRIEDCLERLKEISAPRHHHLRGKGEINIGEGEYFFKGKIFFDSSLPEVGDRNKGDYPHVNLTSSTQGIWNGCHLIAYEIGRKNTFSYKGLSERSYGFIKADKNYDLFVEVKECKEFKGKIFVEYNGIISLEGKKLFEKFGIGSYEKI